MHFAEELDYMWYIFMMYDELLVSETTNANETVGGMWHMYLKCSKKVQQRDQIKKQWRPTRLFCLDCIITSVCMICMCVQCGPGELARSVLVTTSCKFIYVGIIKKFWQRGPSLLSTYAGRSWRGLRELENPKFWPLSRSRKWKMMLFIEAYLLTVHK